MNNIFKSLKEQLHTLSMTDQERADIRLRLTAHMHSYQPRRSAHIVSPYMFGAWHKRFAVAAAAFLVVMLSGGTGLAYASFGALPGDRLYTLKVTTEEIQAAVKTSAESRATFEVARVERRIQEAVTLANQGKLDTAKKEVIAANLKRHTEKATAETSKLAKTHPIEALEVSARLAVSLQAHGEIIADSTTGAELATIAQQVNEARAQVEAEKVTTAELVAAVPTPAISKERLDAKRARILLAQAELTPTSKANELADAPAATDCISVALMAAPVIESTASARIMAKTASTVEPTVDQLIAEADALIAQNNYADAFLKLQAAEELVAQLKLKMEDAAQESEAPSTQPNTSQSSVDTSSTPISVESTFLR